MEKVVRSTRQKRAVYEALVALGHPSATEVYERVRASQPKISRGTVFRVLSSFAEEGQARRLCLEGSDDRFDATLAPHAHAHCRVCGGVFDVPLGGVDVSADGFLAERCEVVLIGVCARCAQKR